MTNKVKPFFIRITDNMTPQMVQDAFDKCVDAGAVAGECIERTERKHKYSGCHSVHFGYFGINDSMETFLGDKPNHFHEHAQEITLDQLDGWLGLEVEQEWDGEGLPPVGVECEYFHEPLRLWVKFVPLLITDIESSPNKIPAIYGEWYHPNDCMWEPDLIDLFDNPRFRKPESPEQKAERELCEAIQEAYKLAPNDLGITIDQYVAKLLYQQGYRKQ